MGERSGVKALEQPVSDRRREKIRKRKGGRNYMQSSEKEGGSER